MSFVSHLECSLTGERYPSGTVQTLSKAGKPLLVRYHLDQIADAFAKEDLQTRTGGVWRYAELLPVLHPHNRLDLGELVTP